jgi:hypothetical protein
MTGNLLRPPNTDGWGNKHITVFACYLDSFIVTQNFSLICQIRDFGSGHPDSYRDIQPRQLYLSPELAKIAAKVPGLVSADGATNAFCLYQLAVRWHSDPLENEN